MSRTTLSRRIRRIPIQAYTFADGTVKLDKLAYPNPIDWLQEEKRLRTNAKAARIAHKLKVKNTPGVE